MSKLEVGYARVNITPALGANISGYFVKRIADGVLDELEACAVAIRNEGKTVLLVAVDHLGIPKEFLDEWRPEMAKAAGTEADAIFVHSTHTHQGPELTYSLKISSTRGSLTLRRLP